jgi:hypothetical protein
MLVFFCSPIYVGRSVTKVNNVRSADHLNS